jgi:hypothetical protein
MKTILKHFTLFFPILIAVLLVTGPDAVAKEYLDGKLDISGYFENFTAYRPQKSKQEDKGYFSNSRNTFYLEMGYKLIECPNYNVSFYGTLRNFYESAFDIDQDYSRASNRNDHSRLRHENGNDRLREIYTDIASGPFQIRIGKQVATWGEADGFRIADIINPLDQSWHWTFEAWEDLVIPVWMMRAWYKTQLPGDISFEAVYIPYDFEPTQLAANGMNWGVPAITRQFWLNFKQSRPDNDINNGEIGFRISAKIKGWDINLHDFYTRSDDPIFTDNANKLIKGVLLGGEKLFKYRRYNVLGGTVTGYNEWTKAVLRGEWGLNMGQKFNTTLTGAPPFGIRSSDVFSYMIGFDRPTMVPYLSAWNNYRSVFISMQMFQRYIMRPPPGWVRPPDMGPNDTTLTAFTLILETGFRNDSIVPSMLVAYATTGWGFFLPSVKYKIGSHLRFILGGGVYWGHSKTEGMGIFRNNDEVTFKIRYEF